MCVRRRARALVLLMGCASVVRGQVQVEGEISFDLKLPDETGGARPVGRASNVTQAAPVECIYQYPETQQVDAMLSTMMNQLTKMFVRMEKHLREDLRRDHDKRFKVVQSKSSDFFDLIYFNMTEEYRRFVNHTQSRVERASDPCEHQSEIRDVWRALLDSSQEAVRRAALACVEEYLRASRGDSSETRGRARSQASQLLRRELARVRREHLALLCDTFQLCYNELL